MSHEAHFSPLIIKGSLGHSINDPFFNLGGPHCWGHESHVEPSIIKDRRIEKEKGGKGKEGGKRRRRLLPVVGSIPTAFCR